MFDEGGHAAMEVFEHTGRPSGKKRAVKGQFAQGYNPALAPAAGDSGVAQSSQWGGTQ